MTKAEKAQRLVDRGCVDIRERTEHATRAFVLSDAKEYHVTLYPNAQFRCTCRHGIFHSHTDELCAHALALKLAVERRQKTC